MMQQWAQFGVLGLVVIGLVAALKIQRKDHKSERKQLIDALKDQSDKTDKRQEETNKIIREHTNVLSSLKALLEHRK